MKEKGLNYFILYFPPLLFSELAYYTGLRKVVLAQYLIQLLLHYLRKLKSLMYLRKLLSATLRELQRRAKKLILKNSMR